MNRYLVRVVHLAMALYLGMSAVELLDRAGVAGEDSRLAETAETLREVRAGDDPFGLVDEVEGAIDAVRRIGNGLSEATNALS